MRITAEAHLVPLLAPLAQEGVGFPLDDEEDFSWLDQEMMKIGSLHHAKIAWQEAEVRAISLLSSVGKDLRVLGFLLHCLQRELDGVRFALALQLFAGALASWWERAYPRPGASGAAWRRKMFENFMHYAAGQAIQLDFRNAEDEYEGCLTAFSSLREAAAVHALPDEPVLALERSLAKAPREQGQSGVEASRDAPTAAVATSPSEVTTTRVEPPCSDGSAPPVVRLPELHLEAGNARDNRHALLNLADFLTAQSPGEPLGYRLRRHATWGDIQVLPDCDDAGHTLLMPPPMDRLNEYRESLARGEGDQALWQRIEHSLSVCLYWLEGHRLSAELAARLGFSRCARAIADEASAFCVRLPRLDSLSFKDGTPFIDEPTKRWLQSSRDDTGGSLTKKTSGEPWYAGLDQARERLEEDDLKAALMVLEAGLAAAVSPREAVYWRMVCGDLLSEAGLSGLAGQHYRAVQHNVSGLRLDEWEPELVLWLESALSSSR